MNTNGLMHYDKARRELAEAYRVDEVKRIRDKARALEVYSKQAQDYQTYNHWKAIRERAEERAGELLQQMKKSGERHKGHGKAGSRRATQNVPQLSDLGISKSQSSRWQQRADKAKGKPRPKKAPKVIIANDFLNRASAFLRDFHWDLRNWLNEADHVSKDDQEALVSGIRHIAELFNDLASEVETIGGK
jgi:hypothetical protein